MVIEAFKDYCKPMKKLTVDRVEFLWKEQSENESFEDYFKNLKLSSKDWMEQCHREWYDQIIDYKRNIQ